MNKKTRKTLVLIFILALTIGGYLILRQWNNQASEREEANNIYLSKSDSIKEISFAKVGEKALSFLKDENGWHYAADNAFPLDQAYLDRISEILSSLKAMRKIDKPDALSDYGLEKAAFTVARTDQNGSLTLSIGAKTNANYYAMTEGDAAVYVIAAELVEKIDHPLGDLAKIESLPVMSEAQLRGLTLSKGDQKLMLNKESIEITASPDAAETASAVPAATVDGTPRTLTVYEWSDQSGSKLSDQTLKISDYLKSVSDATFSKLHAYNVDEPTLAELGFVEPFKLTLSFEDGSVHSLSIGNKDDSGSNYYARIDDSTTVFLLEAKKAEAVMAPLNP